MAPNPLFQATASSLAVVVERVKPRVWPLSKKSLPTWLSVLSTLVIAFFRVFALRMRSNAFARAHAKQREAILATMEVIDKFVRDKDAAARADPANEQKVKDGEEIELDCLPEASRVFRLLWDDVQECRTTRYGFEPSDGRNRSAEALVKRLTALELRQAIRLTRKARDPAVETTSQEESRLLGEHSSGEKLEDKIKFATDRVRKRLGRDFVDAKLIREARALLWQVRSDQRRNLRLLWKLVAPVLPNIVLVFGLSTVREAMRAVFHQIGTWAIPLEAAVDGNWAVAKSYLSWLFCGHLIIDILNMLEGGYRQRACSSLLHNVRNGVMTAMVQQDYEFFDRNSPGVLQERLNHDAPQIGLDLVNRPNQIISKVFGIACNLYGAKIQVSNKVFFMAISPLVPVIACQNFLIRFIARMRDKERKIGEQAASNTGEVLREIRTVRQFAMERREVAEFTRSGNMREEMSERAVVFAGVMEIVFGLTIYGGLLGMLMTGAQDVVEGRLTVSQLLDVMMRLTFNVVFPARELIFEMPEILKMRAPLGRVCDLLESDPKIEPTAADQTRMRVGRPSELREILAACEDVTEGPFSERRIVVAAEGGCGEAAQGAQLISLTSGGSEQPVYEKCSVRPDDLAYPVTACFSRKVRPSRFHGLIEFQSVHFAYPTNPQKPVLKGVSFVVQPGKKVALVGGTGCGKSSIMALLQRLYQPQKGSIKVDGRPIEDYDANFLRSRMVIVDQNTVLFATTLRDNITYGLDGPVDDARVEQVCKDACAWAFIEGKPDSLMSEISTGGSNLSGGERQRVAIARAMIRRPDVILLDEATSALDTKNERLVQDALDKLARQGSALVIAHRLSTIQDSDKIIVVDQGVNMEEGTHSELLRKPSEEPKVGARRASVCLPLAPPVEPSRRGELPGEGSEEREARRVQELRPTEACSPFGPPLQLKRETSAPPVLSTAGAGPGVAGKASYRSLWETTTGSDGTMTVQQMQKRIDQLEGELAGLKGRMGKIRTFMREALDGMVPREASQVFPKSPRMATQDLA